MGSDVAWSPDLWTSAGGDVPPDWDLIPFGDLLQSPKSITVGVMYPGQHTDGGTPLIRVGDVIGGGTVQATSMAIAPAVHHEYRRTELSGDELLITLVGTPGVCILAQPRMKGWNVARALAVARMKAPELRPYIKAVLESSVMRNIILSMLNTTVQPTLNLKEIKILPVPMPRDHCVARALGSVAELFNQRIALLQQTNTTLEAIAQALFKSWFVDFDPVHAKAEGREPEAMDAATAALFPSEFEQSELGLIPKGWCAGRLGDVSSNIRDQAKPDKIDPDTPYFGLEHMPRKSIALSDHGTADGLGSSKFWFEESDILFGKLRPYFHKVGLAPFKGICSTDILVLRPLRAAFHAFLLMHASSNALIDYATRLSNGAKMPRSNWKDIANYPICIPPDSATQAFNETVDPMLRRIKVNVEAASNLAQLRDTLLPRLISGKLRLPEATEAVGTALA